MDKAIGFPQISVRSQILKRRKPRISNPGPERNELGVSPHAGAAGSPHQCLDFPLVVLNGSFRKLGVPYLGVLIIMILLFRVLY